MPVINKLIKKIRTCGLQNPPTRSVPGRGYFLGYFLSVLLFLLLVPASGCGARGLIKTTPALG